MTIIELDNPAGDEIVANFLEHYGVKGMKWGVRNDRGHEGQRARAKKIEKLDKKFGEDIFKLKNYVAIHNAAAAGSNAELPAINAKYKAAGERGDLLSDTPARRKYYKEVQDSYMKHANKAAESMGTNASGTKRMKAVPSDLTPFGFAIMQVDVQHDSDSVVIEFVRDNQGMIVGLQLLEPMRHEDPVAAFLEHYGVKGMKWGVRRGRNVTARFGGKKQVPRPASPDHAQAARLSKKKVHELSNDEIRALKTRLSLEQDLKRVTPSTIDKGTREAERVLKIAGLGTKAWNVAKHPATQATAAAGVALITKVGAGPARKALSAVTGGQV